jgi:hypothetical protein
LVHHDWGRESIQSLASFRPYIRSNSTHSTGSEKNEVLLAGGGGDLATVSVALPSSFSGGVRYPPNGDPAMRALRRIEMEEMLLEQQQQKRDLLREELNNALTTHHHLGDASSLESSVLGNLRVGYAPVQSVPIRDDDSRQLQQQPQQRFQSLQEQQQEQEQQHITTLLEPMQGQLLGQRVQDQQQRMSRSSSHSSITTINFTPEEILLEVKRRNHSLTNSIHSLGETDFCGDIDEGGGEEREREGRFMKRIGTNHTSALKGNADLMNMINQIHNGRTGIFLKNTVVAGGGGGGERKGEGGEGGEGGGEVGESGDSSGAKTIRRQRPQLPLSIRARSEKNFPDREIGGESGPISNRKRQRSISSTIVTSDVSGDRGDNSKETDEDGNNNKKKKKQELIKRNSSHSNSSLDVLLCALAKLDREENAVSGIPAKEEDDESSLSIASSVGMTGGCDKDGDVLSLKESSYHSGANAAPEMDTHATPIQSQMSLIEMRTMRDQLVLYERACWERKLQDDQLKMQHRELRLNAMRERLAWTAAISGGGSISGINADFRSLLKGNFSGFMDSERVELGPVGDSAGGPMSSPSSSSMETDQIHVMLARLRGLSGSLHFNQTIPSHSDNRILDDKKVTSASANPIAAALRPPSPEQISPKDALQLFFDTYGEDAKKSCEDMLRAISETEKSLITIHAWDRSQGLRMCHSRTVVKTRRSRARVKAFLMGVEAPEEPHKKRKRKTKEVKEELED